MSMHWSKLNRDGLDWLRKSESFSPAGAGTSGHGAAGLRAVASVIAVALVAETGDFRRFDPNAKSLTSCGRVFRGGQQG